LDGDGALDGALGAFVPRDVHVFAELAAHGVARGQLDDRGVLGSGLVERGGRRRALGQLGQLGEHFVRRGEALLALFLQELSDDGLELGRHGALRVELANGRDRVGHVREQRLEVAIALKRRSAREHFEQDDAHGVEVRALVDVVRVEVLGGHVLGRPEKRAGLRDGRAADGLGRAAGQLLHESEVEDLGGLAAFVVGYEHDVGGLEVSVNDPVLVHDAQPAQDVLRDAHGFDWREGAAQVDAIEQRDASQELHREEVRVRRAFVFDATVVEDRHQVAVVDLRRQARFEEEPLAKALVSAAGQAQDLERDLAAEGELFGAVHHAHPSFAEDLDEPIATVDDTADGERCGLRISAARVNGHDFSVISQEVVANKQIVSKITDVHQCRVCSFGARVSLGGGIDSRPVGAQRVFELVPAGVGADVSAGREVGDGDAHREQVASEKDVPLEAVLGQPGDCVASTS
jgi:hypothetical protein